MRRTLLVALAATLVAPACAQRVHRATVAPTALATVDQKAPFLKVHMKDGSLYLLSAWQAHDSTRVVTGTGRRYAVDRTLLPDSAHTVSLDSVAVFETNVVRQSPTVGGLAIVTGLSAAMTLYCAANPKACFGSCPTFYVSDGSRDLLQAEGFSASIAPSLEARDVDALYRARPTGRQVRLDMVNEAYETHVVRHAKLLAIRRAPGRRVFHDGAGSFFQATHPVSAARCTGREGDCTAIVAAFDERERTSTADSTNLAEREVVELTFASLAGASLAGASPTSGARAPATPGLVIASRQSLLPTYLLYQAFAYLGTNVGRFMTALQRGDSGTVARTRSIADILGGIDVQVADSTGAWRTVASIRETGPLASDLRVVPLPTPPRGDSVRVRLSMARGAWRVDWAALVGIEGRAEPVPLEPREVRFSRLEDARGAGRRDDAARALLAEGGQSLVTYPGDRYSLIYQLPGDASGYELFLDSRGYYLEWMRDEWLAETNVAGAAGMLFDPAGTLRRLAPAYKKVEAQMDSAFWRSKYVAR